MADDTPSPNWSTEQVLETLRRQVRDGGPASAQVFMCETVPPDGLRGKVEEIVREVRSRGCASPDGVVIGRVHRLARSFSVRADPEFIAEIAKSKDVRAILPSRIDDVCPKPLNRTPR